MNRTLKQTIDMARDLLLERKECEFAQRVAEELEAMTIVPVYICAEQIRHGERSFDVSTRQEWVTDQSALLVYTLEE